VSAALCTLRNIYSPNVKVYCAPLVVWKSAACICMFIYTH
jgi:hypothetical protein